MSLPFGLTGQFGEPFVVFFPVKIIDRVHYHEQYVVLAVYLHVQYAY